MYFKDYGCVADHCTIPVTGHFLTCKIALWEFMICTCHLRYECDLYSLKKRTTLFLALTFYAPL